MEAEYMAAAAAAREALWSKRLVVDFGLSDAPNQICSDSQSAIALAHKPAVWQRSKHIDILHHFVREKVHLTEVQLVYCATKEMIAESLTKVVGRNKILLCRMDLV
jgi:hypothetical protein